MNRIGSGKTADHFSILENIPCGVIIIRIGDKKELSGVYVNSYMLNLTGDDAEEILKNIADKEKKCVHPEDRQIAREAFKSIIETGKSFIVNYRIKKHDRTFIWVRVAGNISIVGGEKMLYLSYTDIDENMRLHDAELFNSKVLEIAADHSEMICWEFDLDKKMIDVRSNVGVEGRGNIRNHYYGFDVETDLVINGMIHPWDVERLKKINEEIFSGVPEGKTELRFWNDKKLEYVWYRFKYSRAASEDNRNIVIGSVKDITDEMLFRIEKEKNAFALRSLKPIVWEYDIVNKKYTYFENVDNCSSIPMDDDNIQEKLIKGGYIHHASIDDYKDIFNCIEDGKESGIREIKIYDSGKRAHWFKIAMKPIVENGHKPERAVGWAVDVTREKEEKQRLEEEIDYQNNMEGNNLLLKMRVNLTCNTIDGYILTKADTKKEIQKEDFAYTNFFTSFLKDDTSEREYLKVWNIFNRFNLMHLFDIGEKKVEAVYHRSNYGDEKIFIKIVARLYMQMDTEDVYAFICLFDNTYEELINLSMRQLSFNTYSFVGIVNLNTGTLRTLFSQNNSILEETKEKEQCFSQEYLMKQPEKKKELFESDAEYERFCKNVCEEVVQRKLRNERKYGINVKQRIVKGGDIHIFRYEFSYLDEYETHAFVSKKDITSSITEEEKQKQELVQMLELARQAGRAKSDFLSSMSHDVRTPLNAIIGMTDLALENFENASQVKESLSIIKSSSDRLLHLVNDILDLSRIENGKLNITKEKFRISEEFEDTVKRIGVLADNKKIKFEHVFDCVHDVCYGDVQKIGRIVDNILGNAIKFTSEGGTVSFRFEELQSAKPHFGLYKITIADSGIGMTKEVKEHIFEPFYRNEESEISKIEGSGLGLAIAKNMINAMSGTIEVESELGKGTVFTVFLPLYVPEKDVKESEKTEKKTEESKTEDLEGMKVLVVEDHPVNQLVARRVIENHNGNVEIAENGLEGYKAFVEHPVGYYDAILMDIHMPVMDGYEATVAIRNYDRADAKCIPIIAMTANAFTEDVRKCINSGMNMHIAKPIDVKKLCNVLMEVTNKGLN